MTDGCTSCDGTGVEPVERVDDRGLSYAAHAQCTRCNAPDVELYDYADDRVYAWEPL